MHAQVININRLVSYRSASITGKRSEIASVTVEKYLNDVIDRELSDITMDILGHHAQLKPGSEFAPLGGMGEFRYEFSVYHFFGGSGGPLIMPSFIANGALGLQGGIIDWLDKPD